MNRQDDDIDAPQDIDLQEGDDLDLEECPNCGRVDPGIGQPVPLLRYMWTRAEHSSTRPQDRSRGWFWPVMVAVLIAIILVMWSRPVRRCPEIRDERPMAFPTHRLRRLRMNPGLRRMVCETRLSVSQLICPLFVRPGEGVRQPITSMPGQFQFSVDTLVEECRQIAGPGHPGRAAVRHPRRTRTRSASEAWHDNGIVQQAIRQIKEACPDLVVITDVCLCEYTDHGHCGAIVERAGRKDVDNDATLPLLVKEALSHARGRAPTSSPRRT